MADATQPLTEVLDAEANPAPAGIPVTVGDQQITVPPLRKWRSSALRHLMRGDVESWAEKTLDAAALAVWRDVDPTVEDALAILGKVAKAAGASLGKSSN